MTNAQCDLAAFMTQCQLSNIVSARPRATDILIHTASVHHTDQMSSVGRPLRTSKQRVAAAEGKAAAMGTRTVLDYLKHVQMPKIILRNHEPNAKRGKFHKV